jgi:hypothetical protein
MSASFRCNAPKPAAVAEPQGDVIMRRLMMAAAAFGGLLMTVTVIPSAYAAPLAKTPQAAPQGVVTPVVRGGGPGAGMRGMGGGGRGMGMRGMGIGRPHIGGGPGRFAGRGGPGPRFYNGGGGPRHGHHGHGHRHRGLYYAAPFVGYGAYYSSGYGYGSGCGWLRRRAEATGSGYWWARYEECVDDNY